MSFGIWQRTITDDAGNVLPGASIEVRAPSANFTGALVSLFSNEAGSTGLSNPFNADSEGFAQFYAAPRKVDIRATGSGSQRTWRNVEILGTAATQDTSRFPYVVGSVAELASVPEGLRVDGALFWVYNSTHGNTLYRWNISSSAQDNGYSVLTFPGVETGRLHAVSGASFFADIDKQSQIIGNLYQYRKTGRNVLNADDIVTLDYGDDESKNNQSALQQILDRPNSESEIIVFSSGVLFTDHLVCTNPVFWEGPDNLPLTIKAKNKVFEEPNPAGDDAMLFIVKSSAATFGNIIFDYRKGNHTFPGSGTANMECIELDGGASENLFYRVSAINAQGDNVDLDDAGNNYFVECIADNAGKDGFHNSSDTFDNWYINCHASRSGGSRGNFTSSENATSGQVFISCSGVDGNRGFGVKAAKDGASSAIISCLSSGNKLPDETEGARIKGITASNLYIEQRNTSFPSGQNITDLPGGTRIIDGETFLQNVAIDRPREDLFRSAYIEIVYDKFFTGRNTTPSGLAVSGSDPNVSIRGIWASVIEGAGLGDRFKFQVIATAPIASADLTIRWLAVGPSEAPQPD